MSTSSYLRPFARRSVRGASFLIVALYGLLSRLLWPCRASSDPAVRSILVIRLDLLGDVAFSMPAVEALRAAYPSSNICMLTLPYTAALARMYPFVDEVVAVDTNRIRSPRTLLDPNTWFGYLRTAVYLRSKHFDLCVSVNGRMASLCASLSGAARIVGYAGEAYPFILTEPLPAGRYRIRKHEVEYGLALAEHAGALRLPESTRLTSPAAARSGADRLLEAAGIHPDDCLVVVHAGAVNGTAKRWPPGHWAQFADQLQQRTGARIVLVGAPSDSAIADEVTRLSAADIVSLAGRTSIQELVGVLSRADLVTSGDSGPLHLAVALARPVLAVYGPTDPTVYGPYKPAAPTIVHRHDLPCSPCYTAAALAECPLGDPICMRLVSVPQMVAGALSLLGVPSDSSPAESNTPDKLRGNTESQTAEN